MEKLTVFGADRFVLTPDRAEVFGWLQCGEGLPCRAAFEREWDAAAALLRETAQPRAAVFREGEREMCVFLTVGSAAEGQITGLFRQERYVLASLLNTLCDEMLFQMDRQTAALLRQMLAAERLYIAERLEPRVDLSPLEQRRRLAPIQTALPEARVSEHGTLFPTKSMMYGITLSGHACAPDRLHDCSRCSQKDCLYRDKNAGPLL